MFAGSRNSLDGPLPLSPNTVYTAPIPVSIPCSVGNVRQALTAKPTWAGFEPLTFAIMGGASHTHNRSTTERVA